MYYQIGTAEPRNCIGSRAAQSDVLEQALEECRICSTARSVKEAWLRPVEGGKMGEVIAVFINGEKQ